MGVDLHIAQQEVVLLYALDALGSRGIVDGLVFRGGTYVRMMVTGDPDFTKAARIQLRSLQDR